MDNKLKITIGNEEYYEKTSISAHASRPQDIFNRFEQNTLSTFTPNC